MMQTLRRSKLSTYSVNSCQPHQEKRGKLSTISGKEQKTVNRNQEKTGFVVKVVMVKVVKLNSELWF